MKPTMSDRVVFFVPTRPLDPVQAMEWSAAEVVDAIRKDDRRVIDVLRGAVVNEETARLVRSLYGMAGVDVPDWCRAWRT